MSNPAYAVIKIGKSAQDPTKYRAKELYQTGVPEPMKVEYSALVEDEDLLERLVHQRFRASRPNKGREFFELDVPTAIKGIRELAAERSPIKYEEVYFVSPEVKHSEKKNETAYRNKWVKTTKQEKLHALMKKVKK